MTPQHDYVDHIKNYLQNEPLRHFGDLDYLKSQSRDNKVQILIEQLKSISNSDTNFFLGGKLFSQIITEEMAQYDFTLAQSYHFQQDLIEVFNTILDKSKEDGISQLEAEQRTAKILWNYIANNKTEQIFSKLLRDRDPSLSPKRDLELLEHFQVADNLVKMVQRSVISEGRSYEQSAYELVTNHISNAIKSFQNDDYEEMKSSFDAALELIQDYEGKEIGAKFATIVGSLLRQKSGSITEGLNFLNKARTLFRNLGDNIGLADSHAEIAAAYWRQGLYKRTLDNLSTEIDLHSKYNNDYAVMISEEKLSHFFRNLSRFNESQQWSLRHLNSAIRASDENMKGLFFLDSNLNYAHTLIGLNVWMKAEKHIEFAERTLKHLKITDDHKQRFILEINHMRGHISVFRGQFKQAKGYFAKREEIQHQIMPNSPTYSRFLRAEATLYRNLREFSKAIKIVQPLFQNKDSLNPLNVSLLAELLALHSHEAQALKLLSAAGKVFSKWNSIHGLSRIYLSMGYVYFLMQEFGEAKNLYEKALEITQSDLMDLKVSIDAYLNLGYVELENGNMDLVEKYSTLAEQCAMMSGSNSFILNSQLLKANQLIFSGNDEAGINNLKMILKDAKELEIWFIQQKINYLLKDVL